MFPAAMRLLPIKDLKDLSVFLVGGTIDMQDLKDLKRGFHTRAFQKSRGGVSRAIGRSRGTGPALRCG